MKMKQLKTRNIISFILAFAMVMSVFFSPLANAMVEAAEPQAVGLKTGKIIWNGAKAQVYMKDTAALAEKCSWYTGIYNGTETQGTYFTGKAQVNGAEYVTEIWVPLDQKTSGLIQFNLGSAYNGSTDFVIPAGTVFTLTRDNSQQIVFDKEYLFDVSLGMIYPTSLQTETMTLSSSAWSVTQGFGFAIGNVGDLPAAWNPATLPAEANCPKFTGNVEVTTETGTETKIVEMLLRGNGEAWIYFGKAGITTGNVTITKDTMFIANDFTCAIKFPKTYQINIDDGYTLTHEQEIL